MSVGDDGRLLTVGMVAARLGVAPETVRSWERRYGLAPGGRSPGGHRRYTETDCGRLVLMQRLVGEGATPARAAAQVLATPVDSIAVSAASWARDPARTVAAAPGVRRPPGGPGGRSLAVPGASPEVHGLARAASRLDAEVLVDLLTDLLVERGAVAMWDDVLCPVLVAAGVRWQRTGEGVDVEHVLSEATLDALRAHRARLLRPVPGRPVLLACAPEDAHVLPLHVAAVALAERRVPVRLLGPGVPPDALASAARRTGASAVFVWRQRVEGPAADLAGLPRSRPPVLAVVGGPGWRPGETPPGARLAVDLRSAVALLQAAPR